MIAFTEVHEKASRAAASGAGGKQQRAAASGGAVVDAACVLASRRGELPSKGWSSRWSTDTKHAALLAAVEAGQMHVVYALQPQSSVFQESVAAPGLKQEELDRLLRLHVTGKGKVHKSRVKEVISWLLETGACLEALFVDPDLEVRTAAASVLAAGLHGTGPNNSAEEAAAARAATLLGSEDWRARATGAEVLGQLGRAAIAQGAKLAALLGDSESVVRMAASAAFGSLRALGPEVAKFAAEALHSTAPRAREAACDALGRFGSAALPHAAALAELLADKDWQVPTAAATALSRIGAGAAAPCARVLATCSPVSRAAVVEALVRFGGEEAANSVVGLLTHDEANVRRHAAECLGSLGIAAAQQHSQALRPLQNDSDKEVRLAAKDALRKLGERPALEVVGSGDAMPPRPQRVVHGEASNQGDGRAGGTGEGRRLGKGGRPPPLRRSRSRSGRRGSRRSRSRSRSRSARGQEGGGRDQTAAAVAHGAASRRRSRSRSRRRRSRSRSRSCSGRRRGDSRRRSRSRQGGGGRRTAGG